MAITISQCTNLYFLCVTSKLFAFKIKNMWLQNAAIYNHGALYLLENYFDWKNSPKFAPRIPHSPLTCCPVLISEQWFFSGYHKSIMMSFKSKAIGISLRYMSFPKINFIILTDSLKNHETLQKSIKMSNHMALLAKSSCVRLRS